jgi:predicted AlkP superfamily pyrophosphatase or phosphodiesterase
MISRRRPLRPWRHVHAILIALCAAGFAWSTALARDDAPLVVLVSLDGFRWDYFDKAPTPNLHALIARGVKAEGLIPAFPSKTFPNHYTIVTGLYPGHHGIVANNIRDPETGRTFAMSKTREVRDPMWWGGEPIWVTAAKGGERTGTMFWPGSETRIKGVLPTYWKAYDERLPGSARVDQVLRWLDLPPRERPSFVTLYFEDTDSAGHDEGPDSAAVRGAIARVDGYVGRLVRGLERRGLGGIANIVVVSDHGMAATIPGRVLELSDYVASSDAEVSDLGPTLGLLPRSGRGDAVFRALARANPHLRVYRRAETPPAWHYRDHPRIPPIVGIVDEGWQIVRGSVVEAASRTMRPERGAHGYDISLPSMRGIFVAAGPAFKVGTTVAAFENVHLYNALASVLQITPAKNDGNPQVARRLLK